MHRRQHNYSFGLSMLLCSQNTSPEKFDPTITFQQEVRKTKGIKNYSHQVKLQKIYSYGIPINNIPPKTDAQVKKVNKKIDTSKLQLLNNNYTTPTETPNRLEPSPKRVMNTNISIKARKPSIVNQFQQNSQPQKPNKNNLFKNLAIEIPYEQQQLNGIPKLNISHTTMACSSKIKAFSCESSPQMNLHRQQNIKMATSFQNIVDSYIKSERSLEHQPFKQMKQCQSRTITQQQIIRVQESIVQSRLILNNFITLTALYSDELKSEESAIEKFTGVIVNLKKYTHDNTHLIANQILVYSTIKCHPNIINYYQTVMDKQLITIRQHYQNRLIEIKHTIKEQKIGGIILQILEATEYLWLHSIHHPTSVNNVVVNFNICKLCDFETSKKVTISKQSLNKHYFQCIYKIVVEILDLKYLNGNFYSQRQLRLVNPKLTDFLNVITQDQCIGFQQIKSHPLFA